MSASRAKGQPKKAPPPKRGKAKPRAEPAPLPGPPDPTRVPLTRDLIAAVRAHLEDGLTKSHAAALVGISKQLLQSWLVAGSADLEAGQMTLRAELALAVSRGQAEYEAKLIRWGNDSVCDRNMNDRWIRYRLQQSNPKEFAPAATHAAAPGATGMLPGTAFETISPSEAVASVASKLERFLATARAEASSDGGE